MADDTRYAYAVARIRGLETKLLDRQWIERLLAESAEGALKVLADSAFQEAVADVDRPEDLEPGLTRSLAETMTTLTALAPEPEVIDLFRVRWDFRNLKSLTKASLLKLADEDIGPAGEEIGLVDEVGTVPVTVLMKAVQDDDLVALPGVLVDAVRAAREAYRDSSELTVVDRAFDLAMWSHLLAAAEEHGDRFLRDYFRTEIDLLNLKAFIRIKEAGRDQADLQRVFIPGARLDLSFFESHLSEPIDALVRRLEYGRYSRLAPVFREWTVERAHTLELACDNVLLDQIEQAKTIAYGVEPLVAYMLLRQLEIKLVRAAMAAKLSGVSRADVEARLRSVHV